MIESTKITDLLNTLFTLDPKATEELVNHRVECNEAFLSPEVPFVCTINGDGKISMGIVGFLNAMASHKSGRVAAKYNDDHQLIGFIVVRCEECDSHKYQE